VSLIERDEFVRKAGKITKNQVLSVFDAEHAERERDRKAAHEMRAAKAIERS
jgi:hypothetical protein